MLKKMLFVAALVVPFAGNAALAASGSQVKKKAPRKSTKKSAKNAKKDSKTATSPTP